MVFEKVRDNQIKISYKPQAVDMIPKQTKGKADAKRVSEIVKGKLAGFAWRIALL